MLTINKPTQYGYRSVYDLPTPPSASRPSPPLIFQESAQKPLPSIPHAGSPTNQPMSAPHRGLPPPAAMTLAQPPPGSAVPQPSGPPPGAVAHSHPVQSQGFGLFPAAPSWHQEESMRTWLNAKAEEEKRRQEEEKTRQEGFRLEQRKMEHDILRTSLQGGIPPPMVPVVFAGMSGGVLPQAALEWAQQYLYSQAPHSQQPALLPPGPTSPDHQRRDSQAPAFPQYPGSSGIPSTPGSAQGPPSAYISGYPGSPTRPRGQSMPGQQLGRQSGNMPNINTSVPEGQRGIPPAHPGISSAQQQEPQPSPGIYFHHWQPPSSSGGRGSSDQPATPSGESPRKRKATGPQQAAPPPSTTQRLRSPPFARSGLSNPPPGRRRGHSRQRSDLGSYRPTGRGRSEGLGSQRGTSPPHASGPASRESEGLSSQQQQPTQAQPPPPTPSRGAHSVSSLLSDDPQSPHATQYAAGPSDMRSQHGEGYQEHARTSEEMPRGGAAGSAATRERDAD